MTSPAPTAALPTDRLLQRYAQHGDMHARDLLVERFGGLARKLARKYHHPNGEPMEDLEQVARLGLIKALDRFDPARGFAFATFATPTILGELRRYFRDQTHALHLPRKIQEDIQRVEKTVVRLSAADRSPTPAQIAAAADMPVEDVLEALAASRASKPRSLDVPVGMDEDEDTLLGEHIGGVDPGFEAVEYGASARAAVLQLSERDRDILRLRFVEDLTQSEIAKQVGISQMQVSRVLMAATQKLRSAALAESTPA
jgi:RNA polymerase sigma-B factor